MSWAALVLAFVAAAVAGCGNAEHRTAQHAIRQELRDPASAEFRAERVRTLWSADGDRLRIYCAEVNANNAFGGKAGFKPVQYVVAVTNADGKRYTPVPGTVWLDEAETPDYYLNCIRPDLERSSGELFMATPNLFGSIEQMRRELDRIVPVLSDREAPST